MPCFDHLYLSRVNVQFRLFHLCAASAKGGGYAAPVGVVARKWRLSADWKLTIVRAACGLLLRLAAPFDVISISLVAPSPSRAIASQGKYKPDSWLSGKYRPYRSCR